MRIAGVDRRQCVLDTGRDRFRGLRIQADVEGLKATIAGRTASTEGVTEDLDLVMARSAEGKLEPCVLDKRSQLGPILSVDPLLDTDHDGNRLTRATLRFGKPRIALPVHTSVRLLVELNN